MAILLNLVKKAANIRQLKSAVALAGVNAGEITTVEPLSNDHPHQRPSLLYDHISCDGQCFLFV